MITDTYLIIQPTMTIPQIYILGNDSQAGTYVLRIRLSKSTSLQFGRFKKGKLISLPAGVYTYVGSALSEKGQPHLPDDSLDMPQEPRINHHTSYETQC